MWQNPRFRGGDTPNSFCAPDLPDGGEVAARKSAGEGRECSPGTTPIASVPPKRNASAEAGIHQAIAVGVGAIGSRRHRAASRW